MLSLGKQGVILAKEEEDDVSGNGNNWHNVCDKHTHLSRRWGTSFKYVYQSLSLSVCVENPVGNKKGDKQAVGEGRRRAHKSKGKEKSNWNFVYLLILVSIPTWMQQR